MLPAVLCGAGELGSKEAFCKRAERRSAGLFSLAGISVMITRLRVPHPGFHLSVCGQLPAWKRTGSAPGGDPDACNRPLRALRAGARVASSLLAVPVGLQLAA